MIFVLLLVALAVAGPRPSPQTMIYYNARMALREGRSVEAVRLWLLRNAVEDQSGRVSPYDADFYSVTWAALGEAGICQDGLPRDDDGAGLWPLALHNHVIRNLGRRRAPPPPKPFQVFEVGRQQRRVSLFDVLTAQELRSLRLYRGRCLRPRLALLAAGQSVTADLSDRSVATHLLRHLLERARDTLARGRVRGTAAIEARLFDIDLQLTALAEREASRQAGEQRLRGRSLGLSRGSLAEMAAGSATHALASGSEAARVLGSCAAWPVSEWMALSPERRLFLFHHARLYGATPAALDRIALGVIDALAAEGAGADLERWIAQHGALGGGVRGRAAIWRGARGQRLLALDSDTGFDERAVIALHRGVHHLEQGEMPDALRSMAFALQQAPASRASERVQHLSRRWLSHVASRFEMNDELLVTLESLLSRHDYRIILEDLMWRAALRADLASFQRGLRHQPGRSALERRLELLRPLAEGDLAQFTRRLDQRLTRTPSETLRFLNQVVQRLELEDASVRAAHLPTLTVIQDLLVRIATAEDGGSRRRAAAVLDRVRAIREGLGDLGPDASTRDRAAALSPSAEVYAGSIRLAPVDPLPWPFPLTEPTSPSVFTMLPVRPVEWRTDSGELVLGWSIGG